MATINRFNKFLPRDYSMKWYMPEQYVPNFEQWDSILAGQQQKYNAAIAATQKYPKHLEWRSDLAGQYKKNIESKVDDITTSFINEGVKSGNRKMRDFAFELNQQWNPGGLAHELEKEFEDYQSGIKQITDYYEKNKAENSANRTYSLYKLKQSAQGEFKYDPETGIYNRSSIVPDLVPYVDIAEEAMKVVKEIKDSGTTDIIKRDSAWFEKIKKTGVTEETIREVTSELLKQPKYAQQRQVEKWLIDQNTTPEQKQAIEESAKKQVLDNAAKLSERIDKISISKKEEERKQLQQQLAEAGYYTGKIDGNIGKDTKNAIDLYKKDLADKTEKQAKSYTYDNIVENQIIESYSKPLIKAFARQTIDRDLIFNKQWETMVKLQGQRQQTSDIITAFQTMLKPDTADYLPTPGLATPMEAVNKMREQGKEVYNESKKSFDQISQLSGLTDIIGYRAPNKIHEVTQARMQSKSYDEFKQRMGKLGYNEEGVLKNAWNFYNSPAAGDLYEAYVSMNSAKDVIDGIDKSQESMILNYVRTPEGRQEMDRFKKKYGFKGTDEDFAKQIMNGSEKFVYDVATPGPYGLAGTTNPPSSHNEGKSFLNKVDKYYQGKPEAMPQSLRGYALTSIKGEGAELNKAIIDDIVSGYTLGYSSDGQAGVVFKQIGTNKKVDVGSVNLDNAEFRFDVNPSGITYYLTGKDGNKKAVSSVVNAPKEHYGRLNRMALDIKKQAKETNDKNLDRIANMMYAITTEGPQYQNAIDDALILNEKNTEQLDKVIDPGRSTPDNISTFKNNSNVKGMPIGSEVNVNGLVYQKFKVYNPQTKSSSYMLTIKTENDLYSPIKNDDGGYYYETSQEADGPIWDRRMMAEIPVEINQQKFKLNNATPEQAIQLLQIVPTLNNND